MSKQIIDWNKLNSNEQHEVRDFCRYRKDATLAFKLLSKMSKKALVFIRTYAGKAMPH